MNFTEINQFLERLNINNITFDSSGYQAIKNFSKFKNFKWHTWHIDSIETFNKMLKHDNIGIMLLTNNKFSNNLN